MKHKFIDMKTKLYNRSTMIILLGCIFVFFVCAVIAIKLCNSILYEVTFIENKAEEQFVCDLTEGMSIEQTFIANHDFEYLTLNASNHEMWIDGKTIIYVRDNGNGQIVANEEIENFNIHYAEPIKIYFKGSEKNSYTITVTAAHTENRGIGFFGYKPDGGETAIVNGEKSEYALSIGTHKYTNVFLYLCIITCIIMFTGIGAVIYNLCRKRTAPERMFLVLAIPLGLVFLCFFSVNYVNDGDAHFARVYHYSNVLLGINDSEYLDAITMRADDLDTLYASECNTARHAQNMYHIIENWKWIADDRSLVERIGWRNAGPTNIIQYFPAVIVFTLGRIIGLGIYPIIWGAKLFSFICYLVSVYYAIKLIPIGKHILVFAGALPMSLLQATGITYDSVILMSAFMLLAVILKIYYDGLSKSLILIVMVCCAIISTSKFGVYTPIVLLLCFIPKERFGGAREKLKYAVIICMTIFAIVFVQYGKSLIQIYHNETEKTQKFTTTEIIEDEIEEKENISTYGLLYAVKEPVKFTKMCMNMLLEECGKLITGVLGGRLPWTNDRIPIWATGLFGICLLLAKNGIGEEKKGINKKIRVGMLGITILVPIAIVVSFLTITPITSPYVAIQGRYLLPLVPLFMLSFRNNACKQNGESGQVLFLAYYAEEMLYAISYLVIFMNHYRTFNYT